MNRKTLCDNKKLINFEVSLSDITGTDYVLVSYIVNSVHNMCNMDNISLTLHAKHLKL